jgi:hypothetical protein
MDKRGEARVPANIQFVVSVHESKEDPSLEGISVTCVAVDFSPHGLQFRTDSALHSKSILNITIAIGEPHQTYDLRGEVRWVRNIDGDHAMGILLQEGADSDRWVSDFSEIFKG